MLVRLVPVVLLLAAVAQTANADTIRFCRCDESSTGSVSDIVNYNYVYSLHLLQNTDGKETVLATLDTFSESCEYKAADTTTANECFSREYQLQTTCRDAKNTDPHCKS